ncbi:hypothetical protein HELRODRAFT_180088 [Helobdella robusta]|uniref:Uncharacterized protein n=1 Tax=Helobdella robusta TaxID=6412 RepID=T1FFG3_HELRO|nr:hypothetical protein HELRODRAFT_180088 [Helobdella robusta]ESN94758.1 hypothetical protein HELRODRAFT_180088 [Helobdella robusta]
MSDSDSALKIFDCGKNIRLQPIPTDSNRLQPIPTDSNRLQPIPTDFDSDTLKWGINPDQRKNVCCFHQCDHLNLKSLGDRAIHIEMTIRVVGITSNVIDVPNEIETIADYYTKIFNVLKRI